MKKTLWTLGYSHPELEPKRLDDHRYDPNESREVDAAIARYVYGCDVRRTSKQGAHYCGCNPPKKHSAELDGWLYLYPYSSAIPYAWKLVETVGMWHTSQEYIGAQCHWRAYVKWDDTSGVAVELAAPMAICRAALVLNKNVTMKYGMSVYEMIHAMTVKP